MAQEIIVECMRDGTVKMEGQGFEGPECEKLMRVLEDAGTVTRQERKAEYYRQPRPRPVPK